MAMPDTTVTYGSGGNPVYQVGGKSFVFFRNPRPDARDPRTGERYNDVVVFWVPSLSDKEALVQDPASPFFTTPHFDGHLSVLLRASRVGELTRKELGEIVEDAWLCRASPRRAERFLESHPGEGDGPGDGHGPGDGGRAGQGRAGRRSPRAAPAKWAGPSG
jgi:hypothetical protein